MGLEIKYFSVKDLACNPLEKHCVRFTPSKTITYQSNPALESQDAVAQIVGVADDHVVGGLFPFPIKVFADGKYYYGTSGSTYWVDEAYRKTGLGIDLMDLLNDVAPDKTVITCGISQKARPIYQLMGFSMFCFSRMVLLQKSSWFWEQRISGFTLKTFVFFTDIALTIYRGILKTVEFLFNHPLTVERVTSENLEQLQTVYRILQQDEHRFREEHDASWFKWILENNFYGDPHSKQFLYLVNQRNKPVAFFMTKTRQQSKNSEIINGSVIEWGCVANAKRLVCRILLKAILSFEGNVSMVDIEVDENDQKCIGFLKKLGLLQLGDQVMTMKALPESPIRQHEGFEKQANWRMRPANGDHGLA